MHKTHEEGNMIDHVILTVSDFKRSVAFYAKALKPLGITTFIDYEGKDGHPDLKGFGDGKRHFFWLKEGKPDPQAVHVGFVAKDHSEVDAFYKAALAAGGKSKESPQARLEYYPGYYATWCLILTATILRSSIKASRRQNIVHQGGATSCWLNTSRSRSSFTPYTEHSKN
jgi:catechol 2,3-dioxygenase-like lactoylglutathione lyase family enzyme